MQKPAISVHLIDMNEHPEYEIYANRRNEQRDHKLRTVTQFQSKQLKTEIKRAKRVMESIPNSVASSNS